MHQLLQDEHTHIRNTQLSFLSSTGQTLTPHKEGFSSPREKLRKWPAEYCRTEFDSQYGVHWVWLQENCPVKFTPGLLRELRNIQETCAARIQKDVETRSPQRMRYQVIGSKIPGIFSLGGDLALFKEKILAGDAQSLRTYAREAVDLVYLNAVNYEQPVTTISLIQGQALGGGFEAAMAANVIVAERQCKLGFPEIMFNMFPGMGAYQLLRRSLSAREAEQMILGAKTYSAEELYGLGIVDVLAEEGEGEQAVWRYIRSHDRHAHGTGGFRRAAQAASTLDRLELYRMVDIWVETALTLNSRDLNVIDYLIRAQQRLPSQRHYSENSIAHQS